jgi:hypothetical protein
VLAATISFFSSGVAFVPPAIAAQPSTVGAQAGVVQLGGRIVLATRGRERVIPVGDESRRAGPGQWRLEHRVVLRAVRPLWTRTDGQPMAEDRAYRRREFTGSGELVGRPVDMVVSIELWADLPARVDGVRASVELDDLTVTAHGYTTRWGSVKSVDKDPSELGRLPEQSIVLSAGSVSGVPVLEARRQAERRLSPGLGDVVRVAGHAYGVRCRYRIVLEGFGANTRPESGPEAKAAASEGGARPMSAELHRRTMQGQRG